MMDYLGMRDGRNPYGSRGGYVVSGRRGRRGRGRDRGMGEDYEDMGRGRDYGDYESRGRGRDRGGDYADYEGDMARGGGRGRDRGQDYGDYEMGDNARGRDGHYPMGRGYMPIEAMGYFNGYYGMGEEDFARGGRGGGRGRGVDRAGGRDYGYDDYGMDYARGGRGRDYGYDYAGDYGENLTKQELEHWKKKLMEKVDDKDKQFFSKENLTQKAKQMGIELEKFSAEELEVATLLMYTDYGKTLGTSNMDLYVRLAKDWLEDKDVAMKGGEKLAVYFDCIVEGEED